VRIDSSKGAAFRGSRSPDSSADVPRSVGRLQRRTSHRHSRQSSSNSFLCMIARSLTRSKPEEADSRPAWSPYRSRLWLQSRLTCMEVRRRMIVADRGHDAMPLGWRGQPPGLSTSQFPLSHPPKRVANYFGFLSLQTKHLRARLPKCAHRRSIVWIRITSMPRQTHPASRTTTLSQGVDPSADASTGATKTRIHPREKRAFCRYEAILKAPISLKSDKPPPQGGGSCNGL
jgi:hypothetical protein